MRLGNVESVQNNRLFLKHKRFCMRQLVKFVRSTCEIEREMNGYLDYGSQYRVANPVRDRENC